MLRLVVSSAAVGGMALTALWAAMPARAVVDGACATWQVLVAATGNLTGQIAVSAKMGGTVRGVTSTALRVARAAGTVCVMRRAGACVMRGLVAVRAAGAAAAGTTARSVVLRVMRTARAAGGAAVTAMGSVCVGGTMRGRTAGLARRGGMVKGATCSAAQVRRAEGVGRARARARVCASM